jgi:predicted ATPase
LYWNIIAGLANLPESRVAGKLILWRKNVIKEIYVDNYKCLVNFRIHPEPFQLWLGDNGTVLDALRAIQRTLSGDHLEDIYTKASLTTWEKRREQTFSVNMEIVNESYEYKLIIQHGRQNQQCRNETSDRPKGRGIRPSSD